MLETASLELEIDPNELGMLNVEPGVWVPYLDLYDAKMVPVRVMLGARAYVWNSSLLVKGHGALLPDKIRELRADGQDPLVVERGGRYYIYVWAA